MPSSTALLHLSLRFPCQTRSEHRPQSPCLKCQPLLTPSSAHGSSPPMGGGNPARPGPSGACGDCDICGHGICHGCGIGGICRGSGIGGICRGSIAGLGGEAKLRKWSCKRRLSRSFLESVLNCKFCTQNLPKCWGPQAPGNFQLWGLVCWSVANRSESNPG